MGNDCFFGHLNPKKIFDTWIKYHSNSYVWRGSPWQNTLDTKSPLVRLKAGMLREERAQVNIGIGRPISGDWIRQQPVRRSWNLLKSTNLLNPNLLGGSSTGWGGPGASCANDPCLLLDLAAATNRQFYKRFSIRLQRQRHDYTGAKPKG